MIAAAVLLLQAAAPADDCGGASTQPEINECALANYRRADDEMNRQWRTTLAEMRRRDREDSMPSASESTRESRLRTAQRAWIAFRDAHCNSAYYAELGTQIAYTMNIYCNAELTEERTRQLSELRREEP